MLQQCPDQVSKYKLKINRKDNRSTFINAILVSLLVVVYP